MDIANLKSALGDAVSVDPAGLEKYSVDGLVPKAVVKPADIKQAASAIKWANDNGASITPLGGGVLGGAGGKLSRLDMVLSTEKLNKIIDIDPANLTVTVQCGVRFLDLQDLVAGVENRCFFPVSEQLKETADYMCSSREYKGAYVPLDPPCPGRATMGGILAANLTGPHKLRNRLIRDLVLGLRFIAPTGEIIGMGGKTVKNVSGYDVSKLMIGSLGCMGLIAELTIRLLPMPEKQASIAAWFDSAEAALGFAQKVLDTRLLPTALEVMNATAAGFGALDGFNLPQSGFVVALGQAGFIEEVDREQADLVDMAKQSGAGDVTTLDKEAGEFFWREVGDDSLEKASACFKANFQFSGYGQMLVGAIQAARRTWRLPSA
jgi:FAD/FMN-containing dehydrogenase